MPTPTTDCEGKSPVAAGEVAIELRDIGKSFGAVEALRSASLTVHAGEIHALLGENGAGKTTLMRIMAGLSAPDRGVVRVAGGESQALDSARARQLGIGMVHQHFMLIPEFTVAENLALATDPDERSRYDLSRLGEKLRSEAEAYGLEIEPTALVGSLSASAQQRVEIFKALRYGSRCLVLDEPTSLLGPREVDALFTVLRNLAQTGRSVLIVTHKLAEVERIADRASVLRAGVCTLKGIAAPFESGLLLKAMTDTSVLSSASRQPTNHGQIRLGLDQVAAPGAPALEAIDLEIKSGEIVGVAGVEGNGQEALFAAIAGLLLPTAGRIRIGGRDVTRLDTGTRRRLGLGLIPENRAKFGIVGGLSLAANLNLVDLAGRGRRKLGWLDRGAIEESARELIQRYSIRPPDPRVDAASLSGGNQQKLIVARELSRDPAVLIASNPTQGLDIGAASFIHNELVEAANGGAALLLMSHDLDELFRLSDRIVVIYRGRLAYSSAAGDIDATAVAAAMSGGGAA